MLRTTLKGLIAHKVRLLTTALAVVLGVAFMAGTLVLTDTLGRQFDSLAVDTNAGTDVYLRREAAFGNQAQLVRDKIDAGLLDTIAEVDGVERAAGRVEGWAQVLGADGQPVGGGANQAPSMGGNWITAEQLNPYRLAEGAAPAAEDQVVIDRGTAQAAKLSVGDRTTVLTPAGPTPVTVSGIATFGDADSMLGLSTVLFTDAAAQQLVGQADRYDGIAVVAGDGTDPEILVERLRAVVPTGVETISGTALTEEARDQVADNLGFFNAFMMTFAVIALFVGAFIISNTFSIIVAQRTRELAVLRAIGASRRQVLTSVVVESVVVGVLASIVGLVAGVGVAAALRSMFESMGIDVPAGSMVIEPGSMITAFVVGAVITVASAVLPARRASKIAPIAALRDTAVDDSAGSRARIIAGVVATAAGAGLLAAGLAGASETPVALVGGGAAIVFLGVATLGPVLARPVSRVLGTPVRWVRGTSGLLARENAARSPKRTAATASALMIGVGLVGFITVMGSSVKASVDGAITGGLTAEYAVVTGSGGQLAGGFEPALAERIAAQPEVEVVTALRVTPALVDGEATQLGSLDSRTVERTFDLDVVAGSVAELGPDGLAVAQDRADEQGWQLGSTVPFVLADGVGRRLTVKAIYTSGGFSDQLVDHAAVAFDGSRPVDSELFVKVADGVDDRTARRSIESAVGGVANAEVQSRSEYAADRSAQIDALLGLGYALLALAVVIGVLGIANTLALSIVERTQELGLLRAIGMTRSQVRSTVRWESVIIALFGTALGLTVGLVFGWAVVTSLAGEGITTLVIPVSSLVVAAVLAIVAGVGAALLPARRAARLDVLTALQAS
jgi:putative ABC transport system permease protein